MLISDFIGPNISNSLYATACEVSAVLRNNIVLSTV